MISESRRHATLYDVLLILYVEFFRMPNQAMEFRAYIYVWLKDFHKSTRRPKICEGSIELVLLVSGKPRRLCLIIWHSERQSVDRNDASLATFWVGRHIFRCSTVDCGMQTRDKTVGVAGGKFSGEHGFKGSHNTWEKSFALTLTSHHMSTYQPHFQAWVGFGKNSTKWCRVDGHSWVFNGFFRYSSKLSGIMFAWICLRVLSHLCSLLR